MIAKHVSWTNLKEYKVLGAKDVPEDWRVYLKKDPDSAPTAAFGSKCKFKLNWINIIEPISKIIACPFLGWDSV